MLSTGRWSVPQTEPLLSNTIDIPYFFIRDYEMEFLKKRGKGVTDLLKIYYNNIAAVLGQANMT